MANINTKLKPQALTDEQRHIKAQIRKGKLPRYMFAKDPEDDSRMERKLVPHQVGVRTTMRAKRTWRIVSTLHELTKK